MRRFGVATDYEYNKTHKRDRITVWSGQFCDTWEASGLSLPSGGYMLVTFTGDKLKVKCPSPRTDANYQEVDAAVSDVMAKWSK
jgi:hypothetical protein